MNTADPSNVLFRIAHPSLYERNPFNILNLPVDATAKDIRRRREDIEAAFDSGTEAEEFGSILPGDEMRKLPTREEVADLFAQLEDPEMRIAHALFWFWPDVLASGNPDGKRKGHSNPNGVFGQADTIAAWGQVTSAPDASPSTKLVAQHNLAVFHHMMGLAYELALEKLDRKEVETPDYVNTYWETSIHWWNTIAGDVDFWRLVSALVSSLGDPRVDYRFARSLRDQFAFSFDQINVELAIGFAKTGRDVDAKRQVKYMAISQPDADDVEGTLDSAFSGLLRQTEAIAKAACSETEKNQKNGFHQAYVILDQTAELLKVSRVVLEKGSSIRNAICTAIFDGVRSCLIRYGNTTKDWTGCLAVTKRLKAIVETPEQEKIVNQDIQIILDNKKQETCWHCGCHTTTKHEVHLYGELRRDRQEYSRVNFKKVTILVPLCSACSGSNTPINFGKHPEVAVLVKKGWKIGLEPSQDEINALYSPSRTSRATSAPEAKTEFSGEKILAFLIIAFWVVVIIVINVLGL